MTMRFFLQLKHRAPFVFTHIVLHVNVRNHEVVTEKN